jgi:lipoprotein LprG
VGSLKVNVGGLLLPLQVVATGGKFWIMRPFSSTWEEVNPQQYGLNDPALLLDPHSGLTALLSAAGAPTFTGKDRFNGEELDEIQVNVNGNKVAELLPGGNPSATDQVTLGITDSGHQLRRLVIRGQVVTKTDTSVYTLVFTNYGENLTVTPPS